MTRFRDRSTLNVGTRVRRRTIMKRTGTRSLHYNTKETQPKVWGKVQPRFETVARTIRSGLQVCHDDLKELILTNLHQLSTRQEIDLPRENIYVTFPQHFLYFAPLPQWHGSFRPIFIFLSSSRVDRDTTSVKRSSSSSATHGLESNITISVSFLLLQSLPSPSHDVHLCEYFSDLLNIRARFCKTLELELPHTNEIPELPSGHLILNA